jgi:hypothetical protein
MNAGWLGKRIPAKKAISLAVLFVFFAGFVMDAPAVVDVGEGPFGAKEAEGVGYAQVNIDTFTVPGHLGEIKYYAKNNPKKVVIHIQDAHCNRYAQRKIADLIAYINAEYGIRTINLEGGVGDYDLAIFTSITGEAIRTEVADYFLKKGELNGAEFFAVNNPDRAFLWGVEDKDLYLANLQVYRDSLRYKEEVDKYLDELSHIMNNLKMHIYTQELITVDMNYNSFKTKKMEFREYFEFLTDSASAHNVDIKKFKNLSLLKDAMDKEEAIDFDRANDERDILIGELKERISRADLRKIVSMTVDFKTKKITPKAFYIHLLSKAKRARIDTGRFPMMTSYLDYVSTFEEVDRFKIMGELDELEAAIKEDIFRNETQRDLNRLSRNSVITKNIFDIQLNKTDYNYYLNNKDSFAVRNYLAFIEEEAPKYRVTARPSRGIARMDDYREELSEFFEFSFMRDEVFLKNMKYERMPYGVEVAILMTGGFHTENLCDLFNQKNISYASIYPKFTIAKGYKSPYFEILAGETTSVQQVLRSALAQASMMQVASFLSTVMAEAVWGRTGLDSFNASVMLYALVARGNAVTFSYTDADDTPHTLDLNRAFNRPAAIGASEIVMTPENIIKELQQRQAAAMEVPAAEVRAPVELTPEERRAEAAARRTAHKRPGAVGAQVYSMSELTRRGYKSRDIDSRDVSAAVSLSRELLPRALEALRAARVKSRAEIESILSAMKSEEIELISSGVTTLDEAISELEGKLEAMKEKPELKSVEVRITDALADEDRAISEFDAGTGVLIIYLNTKGAEEFLADSKALAHLIREEYLEATPQGWDLSHRQVKHLEMIENGFNALTVLNVKELEMMEDAELGNIKEGHVSDPGGFFFRASQELKEMELTVAYKDSMHPVKDPTAIVMGMPVDQWADRTGEPTIDRKYQETVDNIASNRFQKKMGIAVKVYRYKSGDEATLNTALDTARKWDAFAEAAADPVGKPRIVILTDKTLEARAKEEEAKDDVAGMILHSNLAKGQFLRTDLFMQLGTVVAEIQRNPDEADPVLLKLAQDRLSFITGGNYTDIEGRQLGDLTWGDMLDLLRGEIIITIQKIDYGEITEWKRARMAVLRSL